MSRPERERPTGGGGFDERAGTFEGRAFPAESEWLGLDLPSADRELPSADFVERTVQALGDPTPAQLRTFAVPEPAADFVARACRAVQDDRLARWREILARYVAPEPSPAFVEQTLRALTDPASPPAVGRRRERRAVLRTWALPALAAAAVLAVALFLPPSQARPLELRAHDAVPATLAASWASSPLPAILLRLDHDADPRGLPRSGGDGVHLLLQEEPR